ncbi:outer membrane protein [Desulfovibrio sp. Fe33]|uniref:outer membrane protein n=1 Tax=Desulfovibrio sp. Fe33 TaxID=3020842 RepID=UPI00234D9878|nr:outer membrane beta-barrel protein [Desulfovibrio sp. Fe33]
MRIPVLSVLLCSFLIAPTLGLAGDAAPSALPVQWNGLYVGGALGFAYGQADPELGIDGNYFDVVDRAQLDSIGSKDMNEGSLAASVFAGVNHQVENWVLGVEGDFTYAPFDEKHDSGTTYYDSVPFQSFDIRTRVASDWMASLKLRLGYAFGRSLVYLSAGPAVSEFRCQFHFEDDNMGGNTASVDKKQLSLGWTAGAGYEYMLEEGWGIRARYQHYEFPRVLDAAPSFTNSGFNGVFNNKLDVRSDLVQIGIFKMF